MHDQYLDRFVTSWWGKVPPEERNRKGLARLTAAIMESSHASAVRARVASFGDRALYPERPMLRIGGACPGDPVLWLLGWRPGDWTPIHDHESSEVAVRVLQATVEERIWWPDADFAPGAKVKTRRVSRELGEGSTITIPTPYIHTVGNEAGPVAATLHAYFPALDHMRYFQEAPPEGGNPCLIFTGRWDDEEAHHKECECSHDPASCGDRGCHRDGGGCEAA